MVRTRKHGQATFEEHPKGSGQWRVRARVGGRLTTIASRLSETEAREVADGFAFVRSAQELSDGLTLQVFGVTFLDLREERGIRSVADDRSRWHCYVQGSELGGLAVRTIRRRDVVAWRDGLLRGKKLAHQTVANALNLVRAALQEAVERELVEANVARDVRVPRYARTSTEEDLGGVLLPAEQQAVTAHLATRHPEALAAVVVALLTGMRQGEQWALRWGDVRESEVVIRRGSSGPTKSGKVRRMPLLERAREAFEGLRAAAVARDEASPECLVFPSAHRSRIEPGGRKRHPRGYVPSGWTEALEAAGIVRRVRWHDLRHTCATSLLAGWWGRKWALEEVQQALGHASVTTTERYARHLQETLVAAVAETSGPSLPTGRSGKVCSQDVPRRRRTK